MTSNAEILDREGDLDLSIVIPVFNEEGILREAVTELHRELGGFELSFEIIVAENGSTDGTAAVAEHLAGELAEIRVLSVDEPNYGKAMREGILSARGRFVVCDEIDLCDTDFYRRALDLLVHDDAEMVVGSKAMRGAEDQRPLLRRAATRVINGMLRVVVDFRGTDTHGLKAFVRAALVPIAEACVVDRDLFASEFVIRAGRAGVRVVEIPVRVAEKRRPAINLVRRVPNVLANLAKLTYVIRFKGRS
jgi:glycosyltransferase involved in cell wall biosynthesis